MDLMFTTNYEGLLQFTFNKTSLVKGIQKLVQMFILEFMTSLGSDIFDSTKGTNLARIIFENSSGTPNNNGYLYHYAVVAISKTVQSLRNNPSDEATETMDNAEILSIDGEADTATIKIKLTSKAGEDAEFDLPLKYFKESF